MFIIAFLHQLGHSSLLWYGMGTCYSPQLNGIEREAGEAVEMAFFGGISYGGFQLENYKGIKLWYLQEIGFMKGKIFYFIGEFRIFYSSEYTPKQEIDDKQATELTKLDASKGLPIWNISALRPASPDVSVLVLTHATFCHMAQRPIAPLPAPVSGFFPRLKNHKIRFMPKD
jgi:hypothetical protein